MKQRIKLNESQLRKIVKESVKKILSEGKVVNHKPYEYKIFDKWRTGQRVDLPWEVRNELAKQDDEYETKYGNRGCVRCIKDPLEYLEKLKQEKGADYYKKFRIFQKKYGLKNAMDCAFLFKDDDFMSLDLNTLFKRVKENNEFYEIGCGPLPMEDFY